MSKIQAFIGRISQGISFGLMSSFRSLIDEL